MPHAQRMVRLTGFGMLIGGLLLLAGTDFAHFPYALLLCIGSLFTLWHSDYDTAMWSTGLGTLCLLGALLCSLIGIVGQALPLIVWTNNRYGEAGNVIDRINYPLSYFTDRYGALSAFLLLGFGLTFLRTSIRPPAVLSWWKHVLSLLGLLSIVLYLVGVVDIYLDGDTPGLFVRMLWGIFAASWIVLGVGMLGGKKLLAVAAAPAQR
jgi:hypothetical protein